VKESGSNGFQILSDGRKVWVNGPAGESIARLSSFGRATMIDVHLSIEAQRETGTECLDCRHDLAGAAAWTYFVQSVKTNYKVEIGEEHRPAWAI
jgi:hypothetical protein